MKKLLVLILGIASILGIFTVNAIEYSNEMVEVYNRAYENGIISETTIDDANLYNTLTNKELADIMNKYAENVIGLAPNTSIDCQFDDISGLTSEEQNTIIKSCQLGLMPGDLRGNSFLPNEETNRATFGSALSRVLWGNKYEGGTPYYANHLNALKAAGIMNIITNAESTKEVRGYVMLMLMRSKTSNAVIDCDDADIAFACFDPDYTELYENCPMECRKNEIDNNQFSAELTDAYIRAYEKGIISASNIDEADLYNSITNLELADIMNKYSENVIGLAPNTSIDCQFDDISGLTSEEQNTIIKSCQLGLMPGDLRGSSFLPNEKTNRATFGSALSRALWGNNYEGGNPYYINHLNAIKAAGIMNQIANAESTKEIRGYVLLILMRSETSNIVVDCDNADIAFACFDPDYTELYENCPMECRKNEIDNNQFSEELIKAYTRAYENGIISETTIDDANLYNALTNEELADIMIKFSKDTLGKERIPDTDGSCTFAIGNEKLMELCELNLVTNSDNMDLNTGANRALFGTMLSRAMRGRQYEGGTPSYSGHLNALKRVGILNQINNPESTKEIKGYTLNTLKHAAEYYQENICNEIDVVFTCFDPTSDLYKHCPKICRKKGELKNNLEQIVYFPTNKINRKIVFDGTYYALENDTLKYFGVEGISRLLNNDPDYFTKRCEADSGNNNLKLYLTIDGENIGNITIEEACEFGYGVAKRTKIDEINITKGETYNVKVEAEVEAYTEDVWNMQIILQNSRFSKDINNDIRTSLITIRTVDSEEPSIEELSIETGTQKNSVSLKERNQSITTFIVKPENGNEGYLDAIVIGTKNTFSCNDIRFKVNGVQYACHNAGNDLLYLINEKLDSTGAKIDIVLKNEYEGYAKIDLLSINNQFNYKDGDYIPLQTFIKKFMSAITYISKQENKGDYTEFTIGVEKYSDNYYISSICMLTGSTGAGRCLLGENYANGPFEDGFTFSINNSNTEEPINYISFHVNNSERVGWGDSVLIEKEEDPDYFKVNGDYRKVFAKSNNECLGMDSANINHIISGDTITLKWDIVDGDTVQIAIFDPKEKIYKNLGAVNMNDKKFDYKIQWTGSNDFMLTNGCRAYFFSIDVSSMGEPITYTVTINTNNENYGTINKESVTGNKGEAIKINGKILEIGNTEVVATPQKADSSYNYTFSSWTNSCGNKLNKDCTITANFKRSSKTSNGGGGGGGGGSTSNKDNKITNNSTGSNENEGDKINNEREEDKIQNQIPTEDKTIYPTNITTYEQGTPNNGNPSEILENGFTREMNNAYQFAHNNGITTTNSIENASMNSPLTRIAMAKMLSYYAINILGQKPDTSKNIQFNDVTDKQNSDYNNAVTLSYQLGIMGQGITRFRPNDEVTRAEFTTALSRMLYNTEDGKGNTKYYEPHMKKLYNEGIITKNDPNIKEMRGYVMIMLMRSSK